MTLENEIEAHLRRYADWSLVAQAAGILTLLRVEAKSDPRGVIDALGLEDWFDDQLHERYLDGLGDGERSW